jgi:RNA polymerase sigma-70 factor (ECF subfamily)
MGLLTSRFTNANPDGEAALDAASGFLAWVSELVHTHRARLLAYARKRGLDGEEALDVVQDAFVSFLRLPEAQSIARDGDESLRFLTVLVRHNTLNQRRKRSRHARAHVELGHRPSAEAESSEELIARTEELARAHRCILRMAKLQREVILLSLLDERPHAEVAAELGVTEGHVRVLLHRAREHVRHCPVTPS